MDYDTVLDMGCVDQLIEYKEPVMDLLYEDNNIKIAIKRRNSDNVFLCFSGAGMMIANIEIQKEEFAKSTNNSTSIFIIDKTRSWGNFDWDNLKLIIDPYIKDKTIYSLGNSMGGFSAIVASNYFNVSKVIAFAPQWSVNKSIVPFESRWQEHTDKIVIWRHLSLDGCFSNNSIYHIVFGNFGEDMKHSTLFPNQDNVILHFFEGDHYVVQSLKEKGYLYSIIEDIIRGDYE